MNKTMKESDETEAKMQSRLMNYLNADIYQFPWKEFPTFNAIIRRNFKEKVTISSKRHCELSNLKGSNIRQSKLVDLLNGFTWENSSVLQKNRQFLKVIFTNIIEHFERFAPLINMH